MIRFTKGNLLNSGAEALVNAVNTDGVMGKGIALMFKRAFPENYFSYRAACKKGEVRMGRMFVFERDDMVRPKWIITFATKKHWRNPSRLAWIREGLQDLRRVTGEREIRSLAIPALGAGLGGLVWGNVCCEIEQAFADVEDVEVIIYVTHGHVQESAKRYGVEKPTFKVGKRMPRAGPRMIVAPAYTLTEAAHYLQIPPPPCARGSEGGAIRGSSTDLDSSSRSSGSQTTTSRCAFSPISPRPTCSTASGARAL